MYTLRIIDQTKLGAEERRNIFIGGEYSILMSIPIKEEFVKEGNNRFQIALEQFYGIKDANDTHAIDQTIIGFIYANDLTYPIRDFNAVYIVGSEGQTIERVYGQYNKL